LSEYSFINRNLPEYEKDKNSHFQVLTGPL
jgi:hypothetical protein